MNQQPTYYGDDEISLKEIIVLFKEYGKELRSNWRLLSIAGILVMAAAFYYAKSKKYITTYTSNRSFLVQENKEEGSISSDVAFLTSRMRNKKGPNKIQQLATSSSIINEALLKKTTIEGNTDIFANHLINIFGFSKTWAEEELEAEYKTLTLENFYFTHDSIRNFETKEHRALQILREFVKELLFVEGGETGGVTKITVTAIHDKISFQLRDLIFNTLKAYYIEETVGRSRRNFDLLTARVDSLEGRFRYTQRQLAQATDQTYGLISKSSLLRKSKLEDEVNRLNNLYQTFLEQQQQVGFTLRSKTPDFLVIDQTFLPIRDEEKSNLLLFSIVGAILGLILGAGFIIFRKIIRDALAP